MPQSLAQIYLHLVFSTSNRTPYLGDKLIRDGCHKYLGATCNNCHCPVLEVGGVADHVHILCRFGRSIEVADLIQNLKVDSSKWLKLQSQALKDFHWQHGYGAFSISPSHVEALRTYIRNQEAHHLKETFQIELRRLLKLYNLEWDERYVWD